MIKNISLAGLFVFLAFSCADPPPATSPKTAFVKPDSIPLAKADSLPETVEEVNLFPIDYDTTKWTELVRLDGSIQIDLKYATLENFVQEQMYDCNRCFLRPEVAQAVVKIHRQLQSEGYGLKMLDCFRPHPIQWKLWEKIPDPRFVTNPEKGSMHNRGAAVDLTLTNEQGEELDMGTPFDYFGREAYHTYTELSDTILQRRKLLKQHMENQGFRAIRTEWWHYSFREKPYALSDMLWKCYE